MLRKTQKAAARRTGTAARDKQRHGPPADAGRAHGTWRAPRPSGSLSEFEFRLERLAQAYYRWKAACLAAVCDVPLTGDDVAVLNVVRMGDEPKRLSEIGQLLNRVDVPNLQYATRKLVKAGLIETEGSSSRKETRYRATERGHAVTEAYAACAPQRCRRCWKRWTAGPRSPRPRAPISNWSRASIPRPPRSRSRGGISPDVGAFARALVAIS